MKHLNEYINEKMEIDFTPVMESAEKWFRFNLDGFDGGYDTLKSIADGRKLYNEPIDGGIKIKVKEGQEVELPAIIEAIQDFINSKSEDEKAQDTVARLNGYIEEMISGQKAVLLFSQEEEVKSKFKVINKKHKQISIFFINQFEDNSVRILKKQCA